MKFILSVLLVWRMNLEILAWLGRKLIPLREGFLGPTVWANFDGVHYLSIAQNGYYQFEQAFFPLYPLLIRSLGRLLRGNFVLAGMMISHLSLLGVLILLWKLLALVEMEEIRKWAIVFLLFFPTSFFFGSVYTESLFLFLVLLSFYALKERKWWMYFLGASLASVTKFVGVFLLVPIGLLIYMIYLTRSYGDPLFFIHAQPAFGAERSGGKIILLPQVIFRYLKIFLTVPLKTYNYWIAVLELLTLIWVLFLLYLGWKKNLPRFWLFFSLLAVVGPTLTGSLSSMPRYALAAFPIFIIPSLWKNKKAKIILLTIYYFLFTILTILFTRGFFIG